MKPLVKPYKLNVMSESLINSFGRYCKNCVFWSKMSVGEHTGYCEEMGRSINFRMGHQDKEHIKWLPKTTDYSVCDLHRFDEEFRLEMHKELKDNPDKFNYKTDKK